ncbi:MAG TPA: response regulator transcription factor [Chloroflexota bacterium]|nr:response regulator transcription factor [Chloroflexota bacterium]
MPRVVISPDRPPDAPAPWRGRRGAERAAPRARGPRLRVLLAAEPAGRRALGAVLAAAGYRVLECDSARDALRLCATERPDLALLDLEATALGGLELLRRLRLGSAMPIVALGAAGDDVTAIRALDLGADDYVPATCLPELLLARLRAVLRRLRPTEAQARQVLVAGEMTLDFGRRRLFRGGREIPLRPTEWQLLVELARNPGRLLPHEELLTRAWGPEYRHDRSYLRVGIRRLRHKLEDDADAPRYIRTVPGRGYLFEPPG